MSRLWVILALLVAADFSFAQQRSLGASGTDNAAVFRNQVGRRVSYACPARISLTADLWGTDVYTDDSPLCLSAIHAGALPAGQAGVVTLVIGGNMPSFQGSTRNGVTSRSYGDYPHSITFDRSGAPGQVDWTTTAAGLPAELATPMVVTCPAGGSTAGAVWGTDVYTEDSAVCVAAVHAGVIGTAAGGPIAVTALPATNAFSGSTRNGVGSQSVNGSHPAFRVAAAGAGATTSATGGASGNASVTSGLNVSVAIATATVRWDPVPGATGYLVMRWKVGDAACCNNLSPPGALLTATQWVDPTPLPGAGTYGYRLYATTPGGVIAAETSVEWNGVESTGIQARSAGPAGGSVTLAAAPPPPAVVAAVADETAPAPPSNAGRYRVTLTGVQVTSPTKDILDNTDGIGDEIAAVAATVLWERNTNQVLSRSAVRGIEYGDVNAVRKDADRIRAGNAGPGGGLTGQDVAPNGFAPGSSNRTPDARLFPLLVWEGTLTDGVEALLVVPSLWERDVARASVDKYVDAWVSAPVDDTLTIAATQLPLPQVLSIQSTRSPGLPQLFSVGDLAAHVIDRPLGLTLHPLVAEYYDRYVVLTREKLTNLTTPGSYMSYPIQFAEPLSDPVLGCDYTLEIRIERLE